MGSSETRFMAQNLYIHRLDVTSFQVVNFLFMLWWALMIFFQRDKFEQELNFHVYYGDFPSLTWVMAFAAIILLILVSSFIPAWTRRVNHTYKTKIVGLSLSAAWWSFLATVFFIVNGVGVGAGMHIIMSFAAMYEMSRLLRDPV